MTPEDKQLKKLFDAGFKTDTSMFPIPYIQKVGKEFAVFHKNNEWRPDASPLDVSHFITHSLEEYKRLVLEALPKEKHFQSHNYSPSIEGSVKKWAGYNKCIEEIRNKIQSL